ncbi:MAG: thermonuclease family protein [Deltaproteobacteria bacterium]|nr:thermonuclease family protein [Deltaproteobacteria bacterium]
MKKFLSFLAYFIPVLLFLVFSPEGSRPVGAEYRTVKRVVDGDTLILENGEKVRLIGVDTPETRHPNKPVEFLGHEAILFTRNMVEDKKVWLEFDQSNAHTGHKDKYGRTLAYVSREDGKFLNAEIIRQGYGHAYTHYPFKYLNEFRALERQAREQRTGLWNTGKSTDVSGVSREAAIPTGKSREQTPVSYTPTGKPIYEGPRGGLYHWSENGSKSYHPRSSSGNNGTITGTTSTEKKLYEGPRGDIYHYSASGNKVYHSRSGSSRAGRR